MLLSSRMNDFDFQSTESIDAEMGGGEWRSQRSIFSSQYGRESLQSNFELDGEMGVAFNQSENVSSEVFRSSGLSMESSLFESTMEFGLGEVSVASNSSSLVFDMAEFHSTVNSDVGLEGESTSGLMNDSVISVSSSLSEISLPGFELSSASLTTTVDPGSGSILQLTETQDVFSLSLGALTMQSQTTELSFENIGTGLAESVHMSQFEVDFGGFVMTATRSESVSEISEMSFFESSSMTNVSLELPPNTILPPGGFNGFQQVAHQSSVMNLSLGQSELRLGFDSTEFNSAVAGGRFSGMFSNFQTQVNDVSLALG